MDRFGGWILIHSNKGDDFLYFLSFRDPFQASLGGGQERVTFSRSAEVGMVTNSGGQLTEMFPADFAD